MLIAVVSDTHGDEGSIAKVLEIVERAKAEMIIHLGDYVQDAKEIARKYKGRLVCVKGNCDFGSDIANELVEEIEGKRILITHGHRYDVKNSLTRLMFKAKELEVDIALFGHTHIALTEEVLGVWFINPGSAAESRYGAESIAFISIENDKINVNIKELK